MQQLAYGGVGLIIGLVIATLLAVPLSKLPAPFGNILPAIGAVVFGYLGIAVMVVRADDITHLLRGRFQDRSVAEKEAKPQADPQSVLLDSSVIIDGRIADISQTGFIMGPMLIPRFVLNEVQYIADSADSLRRNRGRRGLDMLNKLQRESAVPVVITDMDIKSVRQVDDKLVQLAKQLHCPIVTNDFNLNQVAQLQGVKVLNINDLNPETAYQGAKQTVDNVFENNVIYAPGNCKALVGTSSKGFKARNNIIYQQGTAAIAGWLRNGPGTILGDPGLVAPRTEAQPARRKASNRSIGSGWLNR